MRKIKNKFIFAVVATLSFCCAAYATQNITLKAHFENHLAKTLQVKYYSDVLPFWILLSCTYLEKIKINIIKQIFKLIHLIDLHQLKTNLELFKGK